MNVYTKPDKRFRRVHVRPSKRRRVIETRRWAARVLFTIFILGVVAYWTPQLLMQSPFLRIDTITVQGNHYLANGEVQALVGQMNGQNILLGDLEVNRERLLTSGWVREATLRRVLPSTIEVVVEERTPIGIGRFTGRLYLIDEAGNVIDEYGPAFSDFQLPIIDGLTVGRGSTLEIDSFRAQLAARVITELQVQPTLGDRVSQIDVGDSYNAVLLLNDDPTLIHIGDERFVERLQTYLELAPALHTRVANIDYVDLRFEHRIYVRPAHKEDDTLRRAFLTSTTDTRRTRVQSLP